MRKKITLFRLSEVESSQLQTAAAAAGLKVSAYIRKMIFNTAV